MSSYEEFQQLGSDLRSLVNQHGISDVVSALSLVCYDNAVIVDEEDPDDHEVFMWSRIGKELDLLSQDIYW